LKLINIYLEQACLEESSKSRGIFPTHASQNSLTQLDCADYSSKVENPQNVCPVERMNGSWDKVLLF